MKTNASKQIIVKAVENVSALKYEGNVIFRRYPETLTKNVNRFTLRTKDAHKPGSMEMKDGKHQPKVNLDVHNDVVNEIFKLDPRPHIYVDTTNFGRLHNPNPSNDFVEELVEITEPTGKRKYTKKRKQKDQRMKATDTLDAQVLAALRRLVGNPKALQS